MGSNQQSSEQLLVKVGYPNWAISTDASNGI